jgi:hypothetical protein
VTVQNAVDTTPPTVTITSPANGSSIAGLRKTTIKGSATDNKAISKLELYIDGALKSTATGSSISWNWNLGWVATGNHTITVKAYDNSGNTASTTSIVKR